MYQKDKTKEKRTRSLSIKNGSYYVMFQDELTESGRYILFRKTIEFMKKKQ